MLVAPCDSWFTGRSIEVLIYCGILARKKVKEYKNRIYAGEDQLSRLLRKLLGC
jgi:hypothetical protein